jgi:hypothetical protein
MQRGGRALRHLVRRHSIERGGSANLVTLLLALSNSGSIELKLRMTSLERSPDFLWLLVSNSQLKKKSEGKTEQRKFQRQSFAVL